MRSPRIAIVDSGVRTDHPALKDADIKVVNYGDFCGGRCGHGTAVYNIIRKNAQASEIINFRVTDEDGNIDEDILISCLNDNIRDNYDVDIINLSLGISLCEDISRLKSACDDLIEKGILIVSAFDNFGSISYPAAFGNVIGVTAGEICKKTDDFIVFDDSVVNIGAKGGFQRLAWDNPDYVMLNGNSFACAHTTVQVAKFFSEGAVTFAQIMSKFSEISLRTAALGNVKAENNELFEIRKAVLFPFNKEMHSLVRFPEMLPFEITGIYDIKFSSRVGSTTDHIMKADVWSQPIENVDNIDFASCDTVIIGNIPAEEAPILAAARDALVKKAIASKKNIFSFDDLYSMYEYDRLFCPTVKPSVLPPERFGKLYRISKPVIGIYGTNSAQGKFTLQLELRKMFLENGYIVGQIGTEPSSQLFGMDYVYPMGFNSFVYIDSHDSVRYINECINRLCQKNCDIIITGSQASVLPFDVGNVGMFPLKNVD